MEAAPDRAVGNIGSALEALGLFREFSEGAIAIDSAGRITWINERYVDLLGTSGRRPEIGEQIEAAIPETRLPEVAATGQPILLDIMRLGDRNLVVCRLPLNDSDGTLIGAVGFVFFKNAENLSPLLAKYRKLENELQSRREELARMRRARFSLSSYLGISEPVVQLRKRARLIATRDSPVLISGETGVGKELLAHGIHLASHRADGPFVTVNVAALMEGSIETEFFGSVMEGPDGARHISHGKLALADGGTLFLDEVGNMPMSIQAKFLRTLEDGTIEPVGSREISSVSARIIATTSANLEQKVKEGSFRSDLYYRLAVLPVAVPPLRIRTEDIDLLVEMILDHLRREAGGYIVSNEAMLLLRSHPWPGNVRELRNVLERASLEAEGELIDTREVALALASQTATVVERPAAFAPPLSESLRRAEKTALIDALLRSKGNREDAARKLGISRSSLYGKLKSLGVDEI